MQVIRIGGTILNQRNLGIAWLWVTETEAVFIYTPVESFSGVKA